MSEKDKYLYYLAILESPQINTSTQMQRTDRWLQEAGLRVEERNG